MNILEFENFSVSRGGNLLFSLGAGSVTTNQRIWLKAPNGSGKSTFIGIICGFDSKYDGKLIRKSAFEPGKPTVCAVLPEHSALNEKLLVKNLLTGYHFALDAHDRVISERVTYLQDHLKIEELTKKPFGVLSKGERKRVMLCLCLITRFDLLILDEAFDGLDDNFRSIASRLVQESLEADGRALLATSHTDLPSDLGISTRWEINNQKLMVSDYEYAD